jgi:hypothetical protein
MNALHTAAATTHLAQLLQQHRRQGGGRPRPSQGGGSGGSGGKGPGAAAAPGQARAAPPPHPSSSRLLRQLAELLDARSAAMSGRQLSNCLWALSQLMPHLRRDADQGPGGGATSSISSIGSAHAAVGALPALLARRALLHLGSMNEQELSSCLHALLSLGQDPGPSWLEAWLRAATAGRGGFGGRWASQPQAAGTALWGMARAQELWPRVAGPGPSRNSQAASGVVGQLARAWVLGVCRAAASPTVSDEPMQTGRGGPELVPEVMLGTWPMRSTALAAWAVAKLGVSAAAQIHHCGWLGGRRLGACT